MTPINFNFCERNFVMKRLLAIIVCFTFFLSPALAKQKIKTSSESEHKASAAVSEKATSNKWLNRTASRKCFPHPPLLSL